MILTPEQKNVRISLERVLRDYRGAVLYGEMGVGKTWIAADVASSYDKVLFITEAKAVKDIKAKLEEYEGKANTSLNVDVISYHHFANYRKLNRQMVDKYDLFIWDECHKLRNYSNGWTTRYVRMTKKKHLHLTGTPLIKSPKDFVYVLRKCGLFSSTKEFYERYFNAQKSNMGDFMELGPFRNEDCFKNNVAKVTESLKHTDIAKDMPSTNFEVIMLEGAYTPPEDITKETKTRIEAGLKKVKPAVSHITKVIKEKEISTALILCYFHDTAKALQKELGGKYALTKEKVRKEFKELAKNGGVLITTLGLTSSSLDLNECDNVFMVESTYSYPLDRQSIDRCMRLGKKNDLNVYYYTLEGEHSIAKSFSRQYLTEIIGRSGLSPSQMSRLEKCPGSYWLPSTNNRPEYVQAAASLGTDNHEVVERYLSNTKIPLSDSVPEETVGMILYCRDRIVEAKQYGVESQVNLFSLHKQFLGTVDFWSFDGETLHVVDYKNGNSSVAVKNNLQLISYTLMILHTYNIVPKNIHHVIWQKDNKKTCIYQMKVVKSWEKRIKRIIENVMKAEKEPLKYLNPDHNCDFFCPAREYHETARDGHNEGDEEMAKQFTAADRKYPRLKIAGKAIFVEKKKAKGYGILTLGLSFPELSAGLKKLGKTDKAVKAAIKYSKDHESFSTYVSGFTKAIKGEQGINQFDEVEVEVKVKPPNKNYNKAQFEIVKIDLLSSQEDEEVEDAEITEEEVESNEELADPWND